MIAVAKAQIFARVSQLAETRLETLSALAKFRRPGLEHRSEAQADVNTGRKRLIGGDAVEVGAGASDETNIL